MPPFRKKRLTDTYLSDQHVAAFALPPGDVRVAESDEAQLTSAART